MNCEPVFLYVPYASNVIDVKKNRYLFKIVYMYFEQT